MFDSLFFLLGPVGTAGTLLLVIAGSIGALMVVTSAPSSRRYQRI